MITSLFGICTALYQNACGRLCHKNSIFPCDPVEYSLFPYSASNYLFKYDICHTLQSTSCARLYTWRKPNVQYFICICWNDNRSHDHMNGQLTEYHGIYIAAVIIHVAGSLACLVLVITRKRLQWTRDLSLWFYLGGAF